ncbi:unnamed protein product [Closterium sp. NIES-54]
MTRLLLPVLVLLAAFAGTHGIASSGSASLPDGATCYLDSERRPVYPFCRGNKRNCVVTQVPSAPQANHGTFLSLPPISPPSPIPFFSRPSSMTPPPGGSFCRYAGTPYAVGTRGVQSMEGSTSLHASHCLAFPSLPHIPSPTTRDYFCRYAGTPYAVGTKGVQGNVLCKSWGSFCRFSGTPYAVGTKGVQGNALCKTCDCSYRRKMPGPNRAVCSCSSLPACYVDYNGQPVGKFRCPTEQNMCVITKIGGGGKDKKGLPVDKGVCVFSGIQGICGAAGPSWGPKFYMAGIEGMPKPGDRCSQCTCGATGGLLNCKRLANCKTPQSFGSAAELAIVLQNV